MEYLRSQNPFIKLMIIGKVNKSVNELLMKNDVNEIDDKVIKGIFSRVTS